MKVSTATVDDAFEIHELAGRLEGLVQHPVHFYNIMIRYFGNSFFLAKDAGRIVGFVWGFVSQTGPEVFFLWQIGVEEEFRGTGTSYELIGALTEFAKESGCRKVCATVETANIASARMFEKMGFENASKGDIVVENDRKAMVNYYGSGTNQVMYEFTL